MTGKALKKWRVAVLDLGTNTFHLLIADVFSDHTTKKVFKSKKVVELGEGGILQHLITVPAFKRGIDAVSHFFEIIKNYKADQVNAYATAAVRNAINGNDFTGEIFSLTGIRVNVIDGLEEARLICLGVRQCIKMHEEPELIMDIGGGSTEFIIASRSKVFARHSFNIGAALLLEKFDPSDPIAGSEIMQLEELLDQTLKPLDKSMKEWKVRKLTGSSGSFDTFADMIGHRFYQKSFLRHANSYHFKLEDFYKLYDLLIHSTYSQRLKMKGLIKMRVDMIVLAVICTRFVLKRYGLQEMAVSKFSLKEGAMWEILNTVTFNPLPDSIRVNAKVPKTSMT